MSVSKKIRRILPCFLWFIVIVFLSGYPGNKVPQVPVWQFDKLVHTLIYFILSITLIIAFYEQYQVTIKRLNISLLIIIIGIFYGGTMEILQHYIFINRSGNWYDFIANAVGAIAGVICYPLINKLLPINRWMKIT